MRPRSASSAPTGPAKTDIALFVHGTALEYIITDETTAHAKISGTFPVRARAAFKADAENGAGDASSPVGAPVPDLASMFLELGLRCKSVVACRVSPDQKAKVVQLVRDSLAAFLEEKRAAKAAAALKQASPTIKRLRRITDWIATSLLCCVCFQERRMQPICLAIGDGANDVPMIQEAAIGVGISGKEGAQAANSADFSVTQFKHLKRLLMLHGRWNYRRSSKLVIYSFYKNMAVVMCDSLFGFFCFFSAQSFWVRSFDRFAFTYRVCSVARVVCLWFSRPLTHALTRSLFLRRACLSSPAQPHGLSDRLVVRVQEINLYNQYNFVFTMCPIIAIGLWDKDVSEETIFRLPFLYGSGRLKMDLNLKRMAQITLLAFTHACVIVIIPLVCTYLNIEDADGYSGSGFWTVGTVSFAALLLIMTQRAAMMVRPSLSFLDTFTALALSSVRAASLPPTARIRRTRARSPQAYSWTWPLVASLAFSFVAFMGLGCLYSCTPLIYWADDLVTGISNPEYYMVFWKTWTFPSTYFIILFCGITCLMLDMAIAHTYTDILNPDPIRYGMEYDRGHRCVQLAPRTLCEKRRLN
jgi:magnesium-transporting ATPase (P-type)